MAQWRHALVTSRKPPLQHVHAGGLGFCLQARGEGPGVLGSGFQYRTVFFKCLTGFQLENHTDGNKLTSHTIKTQWAVDPWMSSPCALRMFYYHTHVCAKNIYSIKAQRL